MSFTANDVNRWFEDFVGVDRLLTFKFQLYYYIMTYGVSTCRQVVVIFHTLISEAYSRLEISTPQAKNRYL